MSEDIPLFGIGQIVERGVAEGGDVGVLGIVTPEGERARLFMRHNMADLLALELNALIAEIHQARSQSGKEARSLVTHARKIAGFGVILEHERGDLMLDIVFEGGVKMALGLTPETVDSLIAALQEGKQAMLWAPPAS